MVESNSPLRIRISGFENHKCCCALLEPSGMEFEPKRWNLEWIMKLIVSRKGFVRR